ncbi:MAG: pyridoxamine 5'-phosphate oxidase family protein [Rhodobacteraceae bacterium]|nr:pyridoxamine 5'-phosphate oxidase family protein [Paracoccaceae bacterium]
MRARLPSRHKINEDKLSKLMQDHINSSLAGFIEKQPFFFIATANGSGECDANFRARNTSASGRPQALLLIADSRSILFPDFAGNGFYNSLGNIHQNPHIGLLFIDFQDQRRARINGQASIASPTASTTELWPEAQAIIHVDVKEAYNNCSARIPKLKAYTNTQKMVRLKRR